MEVGVNAAIILHNLYYWVVKNEANETNFHDGRYWTYNTVSAYQMLFPYLSIKQVRTSLKKLEDGGYIVSGNYNELPFDRTKWYALTEKGYALEECGTSICQNGQGSLPLRANGDAPEGKAIPDIKPDIKPDRYRACEKPGSENLIQAKPKKHRHGEFGHVLLTDEEFESLDDKVNGYRDAYIRIVDEYCEQSGRSYKNYSLAIQNFYRRDLERNSLPKVQVAKKAMTFGDAFAAQRKVAV